METGFVGRGAGVVRPFGGRALAVLLGAVGAGQGARAAAAEPATITRAAAPARPRDAPAPAAPALVVVVSSDDGGLDPEIVRLAVSDEMAAPAVVALPELVPDRRGVVTVTLSRARGELAVSYQPRGRGAVARVVGAPGRIEDVVRHAAWLAGNLARDEARELLGAAPPEAPPPPPAPPPLIASLTSPSPPAPAPPPVVRAPVATAVRPSGGDERRLAPIAFSLFYPLATNYDTPQLRAVIALNLLQGRVGALDGFGLGVVNQVDDGVRGVDAALAVNIAGGDVRGLQAALLYNRTRGRLRGAAAALVNDVHGEVDGAEVGAVNRAGDVRGLQLGLVNVANQVHGVQLGLVNFADDVSGVPIGLVSVTRSGGIHPLVWSSTTAFLNAGIKFSTHQTYTELSASAAIEDGIHMYGPGLALGGRLPFQRLIIESDLGASYLFGGPLSGVSRHDGLEDDMAVGAWRARAGLALDRRFTLFVGGGVAAKVRFYQPLTDRNTLVFPAQPVPEATWTVHVVPHLFAGVQL